VRERESFTCTLPLHLHGLVFRHKGNFTYTFKVMLSYLWLSCPHVCLPSIINSMFIQQLTEVIFPSIQSPVEISKQIPIITLQQAFFSLLLFISSSCVFRTSVILRREEKADLVIDSHSILARWRNCFSQLFNVHGVSDVRQKEIHTAEPLVPEPSAFKVEMAIEMLKRHKSTGVDEIPAELIKYEVEQFTLRSNSVLVRFRTRRNCLRSGRSQSWYLFIRRAIQQSVETMEAYHFCYLCTKCYRTSCC